ncbi:unnamed protein product [Paramecium primaurelia]|uniref:Uncharacterized protein n=1 Tax=Paramecium primaurelia TaxID=5886 RepID=A0A8S1KXV5_PARPR|nr:unnamed protein product [Paramecium primaurelia]
MLLQLYDDLRKQTTEEIERVIQRKDDKLKQLEKEKTEQDIRYKDELQKINEELNKRSHFKDEKENLIKEIHDLKEEMIKKDYAHKKILIFNQILVLKSNKLKNRNQYLKSYIANEVTKQTNKIEIMKYQSNTKVQELEMQLRNLRNLLDQRSKELKTFKALAQMILDQRSDIEQFVLQTIDQVKNEMQIENKFKRIVAYLIYHKNHKIQNKTKLIQMIWIQRKRKVVKDTFLKNELRNPTNKLEILTQSLQILNRCQFIQ